MIYFKTLSDWASNLNKNETFHESETLIGKYRIYAQRAKLENSELLTVAPSRKFQLFQE